MYDIGAGADAPQGVVVMEAWEQLENLVKSLFPGAKKTKRSGATWGDGDLGSTMVSETEIGNDLSIEVKDQKRASLDSWWSTTRRQAMRYGKEPVLVMRRPPAQLDMAKAARPELVACCNLSYFVALHKRVLELERERRGEYHG